MNARAIVVSLGLAAAALAGSAGLQGQSHQDVAPAAVPTPQKTGYISANGLKYYYAVYGKGEPLLLLHGGLGQIEMFGPNLTKLSQTRQVIGVDLQGHGRTRLGSRPIEAGAMGDDMAALLDGLGYRKVDVMGFSLGGAVAFRLAVQHPAAVRRLVLVSTPFAQRGFYPEVLPQQAALSAAQAAGMKGTPLYQAYAATAPDPSEFPRLLDAMGTYMRRPYDWSADAGSLRGPVLLVYGDADIIRPEHMVEFYHLLGGGLKDAGWMRENMSPNRLAVIPGATHYNIFTDPRLASTVAPFLEAGDDDAARGGGSPERR